MGELTPCTTSAAKRWLRRMRSACSCSRHLADGRPTSAAPRSSPPSVTPPGTGNQREQKGCAHVTCRLTMCKLDAAECLFHVNTPYNSHSGTPAHLPL